MIMDNLSPREVIIFITLHNTKVWDTISVIVVPIN